MSAGPSRPITTRPKSQLNVRMESNVQRPMSNVKNKTGRRSLDIGRWTLDKIGDALLFVYFIVLARQYLWWCTNDNSVAWSASVIVAAVVAFFYFSSQEVSESNESSLPFWLIGVLPLVFVYAMRVVFPDTSFDVLNYRLLHAERSLVGCLYLPGDFFPTPAPYNPAPDMVTGLFRHALGYRLGTIANLLALIWAARITDKLLRPLLQNVWLRATGVMLAVMAEHLLFEINNYMADLLALPLLLEATYLALHHAESKKRRRNLLCIALLLGIAAIRVGSVTVLSAVCLALLGAIAVATRIELTLLVGLAALTIAMRARPNVQSSPWRQLAALLHVALFDTLVATEDARMAYPRPGPAAEGAVTPLGPTPSASPTFPSAHAAVATAASSSISSQDTRMVRQPARSRSQATRYHRPSQVIT